MKSILSVLITFIFVLPDAHAADQIDSLKVSEKDIESGRSEKKLLATEVLVSQAEQKALAQIQDLIKKYRGTSMEPGLIYRLAELYMTRAKSARFVEQITKEQGQAISFLPSEVKGLKEKNMILKAIQKYGEIERRFPKYTELDQVIFNMAFAYLQVADDNNAEKAFIRLLKKKPRSKLVPDAYLAVGEINFKRLDFKRALAFYARVKKYKNAKAYPYGMYKGAWCYYNLKGYEQAISDLEKVIAFGANVEKKGLDQRMDIRNEALIDMALFYSTVRKGADAVNYFIQLAGTKDPVKPLQRLSKIYERHGKNVKQQAVLLSLIEKFDGHSEEPHFYKELAKNYDRQLKYKKSAQALWSFNKSCLSVMKKDESLDETFCQEEVDKISKNLAIKWLNNFEKQRKNPVFSEVAEVAFRVHLYEKEPTDDNSKMRFYFAEHIFGLKKFLEASQEYDKVGDSTNDKERKHKSRYAAIFSFDKHFNSKYEKPEEEIRFKELSNKYMTDFPKGKEYLNVSFKLALFDYTKKNYEDAAPLLLSLGEKFSSLDKGKKSQDLYLDILNSQKEYVQIQKYAKQWKSKEQDPIRAKSLQKLFEQSFFSEVEVLEKAKNYKQALIRYEQFINENPNSQYVDEARWNKISMHFKLKEYDKTAESYVSFYNLHPKHKNVVPGLVKAVEIYEMMAEPEKAVAVTKILEKVDPKNRSRWFYLTSSYLMSSGQYELAAKNFFTIMSRPGVFKDSAVVSFFSVSSRLDRSVWYQTMLTNLLRSPNKDLAQRALNSKIEYLERQGNKKDLYDFVYKEIRITKLDKSQKGPLYYYRGKKKSEEFLNAKISNRSMNTIVSGIQRKIELLNYAQNLFQKGLSADDQEYVINSLIGLSELYDSYVRDLKSLKPPSSFGPEETEVLNQELANIIMPFEEKSADVLNQATEIAESANFRDGKLGKVRSLFDVVNLDEKTVPNLKARLPASAGPRGI